MSPLIPFLAPIATLIVGLFVAFIAWQQWRVAESKLRLDLFDRRYKVFEATRQFVAGIMREATFSDAQLFAFYAATSDAKFLFGEDVVDYLKQIRERSNDMRMHQQLFQPLQVGEERSRHVQIAHDQLLWIGEQLTEMSTVYSPYLSFSHVK